MSKNKETDGFTGEGYEEYPNLYLDAQRLHDIVNWSDEHLTEKMNFYARFLGRASILPGHRIQAQRLHTHMLEESCWRADNYDALSLKDYDELCEGTL